MASIGARSIAHKPQPAIPIQSATTRKRLRSESSISRSIMRGFQRRPSRNAAVQNIYGRMHTSLPPNRQAEERHQETQLRKELQKRIRSGGKHRACIVRAANAVEPGIPKERLQFAVLLVAKEENQRKQSTAHETSR